MKRYHEVLSISDHADRFHMSEKLQIYYIHAAGTHGTALLHICKLAQGKERYACKNHYNIHHIFFFQNKTEIEAYFPPAARWYDLEDVSMPQYCGTGWHGLEGASMPECCGTRWYGLEDVSTVLLYLYYGMELSTGRVCFHMATSDDCM